MYILGVNKISLENKMSLSSIVSIIFSTVSVAIVSKPEICIIAEINYLRLIYALVGCNIEHLANKLAYFFVLV